MDNKISQNSIPQGNNPIWLSTCHSTNEFLKELIKTNPISNCYTVSSKVQTAGKGQRGTVWESEPYKNLTFSTIYYFKEFKMQDSLYLTCAISLGVVDCLELLGYSPAIKWPNDIYLNSSKVAGILNEIQTNNGKIESCISGIGLNVNQTVFANKHATSLKLANNQEHNLEELLILILKSIRSRIEKLEFRDYTNLLSDYYSKLYLLNKVAAFKSGDQIFMGIIRALDQSGRIIIETENKTRTFFNKEVEFLK